MIETQKRRKKQINRPIEERMYWFKKLLVPCCLVSCIHVFVWEYSNKLMLNEWSILVHVFASSCTFWPCACIKGVINRGPIIVSVPWVPCPNSLLSSTDTHTHTHTRQQTCNWTSVCLNHIFIYVACRLFILTVLTLQTHTHTHTHACMPNKHVAALCLTP